MTAPTSPPPSTGIDEAILAALREVDDPELGVSIVDLGLVTGVAVEDGRIRVTLMMTTPTCPLGSLIADEVVAAIGRRIGPTPAVEVILDRDAVWSPDLAAPAIRERFARKPSRLGSALAAGLSRLVGAS